MNNCRFKRVDLNDIYEGAFNEHFDYVVCKDVLMYLDDIDYTFNKLSKISDKIILLNWYNVNHKNCLNKTNPSDILNIIKKYYKIKLVKKLDMSLGCVLGFFSGIIYYETLVMIIGAIPVGAMQDLYVLLQNSAVSYAICLINPFDSILNLISFNRIANFVYLLIT